MELMLCTGTLGVMLSTTRRTSSPRCSTSPLLRRKTTALTGANYFRRRQHKNVRDAWNLKTVRLDIANHSPTIVTPCQASAKSKLKLLTERIAVLPVLPRERLVMITATGCVWYVSRLAKLRPAIKGTSIVGKYCVSTTAMSAIGPRSESAARPWIENGE